MNQKPEPKVCAEDGHVVDWVWDHIDNEWELDGMHWFDPLLPNPSDGFLCSRKCYLARLQRVSE